MYQLQVTFGEAIKKAFSQYCCFTGRASRSEYWWFCLFTFLVGIAAGIIDFQVGNWFSGLVNLALLLPSLGLCWRRLHDIGKAGGWYFIGLIPIVGWVLLIVWFCRDSEPQANRFGEVPNLVSL